MKKVVFKPLLFLGIFLIVQCKPEELLKVTKLQTGAITEITATTAIASGSFIDLSGNVPEFGHCWNKTGNPDKNSSKYIVSGTAKKGEYTSNLTGLESNTKYYVKAYALDNGTGVYGSELEFTTLAFSPTLVTQDATGINGTSATLNGTVNANGASVSVSFEWGTTTQPMAIQLLLLQQL